MKLRRLSQKLATYAVIAAMSAGCAPAQQVTQQTDWSKQEPNGISVGRPKVFDNRTLTIMLESLNESLKNMQFVDQKSLAAAFGLMQGFKSSESSSNLSISTLPIGATKQEVIAKTGNATNVNKDVVTLPDSTQTTTTTNRDALVPQQPSLDSSPAFSGFNPNYGENVSDLLSDQVNLNYQIFNLRMLLERSLSDRLVNQDARLQAVLGFNVTIDPPRTANDAVAVVEVTLTSEPASKAGDLSLVSLMPQEKTYNSATLSTKSHAFGGSAVVHMIQVGYTQRRRGQLFYLYRDNDTIAYERMKSNEPNKVVFGWMFRPVLGRRSISPGLRQMYAIVALPHADKGKDGKTTDPGKDASTAATAIPKLNAEVRTYWKKYDAGTMTSFTSNQSNRANRFRHAVSLGLTNPELFGKRWSNGASYNNIEVRSTEDYQSALGPTLDRISWTPVGSKSAVVTAVGNNFFAGTQVIIGDKAYSGAADGLILKSNIAFDLTTSLDALANGPGVISGRYGSSVPLALTKAVGTAAEGIGIDQDGFTLGPTLSGFRSLNIKLSQRTHDHKSNTLTLLDLPKSIDGSQMVPIVTVNGHAVPLPYALSDDALGKSIRLQANIPDSFISNGGAAVKVSWPFLPPSWTVSRLLYDPASVFQISKVNDTTILIASKDPEGFTGNPVTSLPGTRGFCWKVFDGSQGISLPTNVCPGDKGTTAISDNAAGVSFPKSVPKTIVLIAPYGTAFVLETPKASTADNEGGKKQVVVKQFDSIWVNIPLDILTISSL